MKKFATVLTVLTLALWAGNGFAYTIVDNYIGGDPNWGSLDGKDLIGDEDDFEIYEMDVGFDPNTEELNIDIHSSFFDDDSIGMFGVGLGDLFISTDGWDPFNPTSQDYSPTLLGPGEDWEYVVVLDNHRPDLGGLYGSVDLYLVVEGNIIHSYAPDGYGFREYQEVQYEPGANDSPINEDPGSWGYGNEHLWISISLAGVDIGDETGFHYSMTCANDVIEGSAPVPEPATMLLFGTGLIGMVGLGRKKFLKR